MFEARLRVLLITLGVAGAILVARLFELQAVHADYYRERTQRAMRLTPQTLPFVRGSIRDRRGEVLACDEPSWDITVRFDILAADAETDAETDADRMRRAARLWKRHFGAATDEEAEVALRDSLQAMWFDIDALVADEQLPLGDEWPRDRAADIVRRVMRVHEAVSARRGFDTEVLEETQAHAVVSGLSARQQIAARERLAAYPWVSVSPSSVRRAVGDAVPLAHVLGRLGRVDADTVDGDDQADDTFARYLASETHGVSGVEYAAERQLRGRRGQITQERDGSTVEIIDPEDGHDVFLTLDAELQRRLYDVLGQAVSDVSTSPGGAMVVLDVPSREVLALVSYPSYDPNRFDVDYAALRDDTRSLPLRFRAVSSQYAPGSTIKPLACLAGLMSGRINLDTRVDCTGYLFPGRRDAWRCWEIHGTGRRMAHGPVDVTAALTGSCNIFMYHLGEAVGVDGLCAAFDMVGLGRSAGLGLIEEAVGVNPTPSWLAMNRDTPVYPAHARNFAIGQGELLVTPVQLANLMATYASGVYRPVSLIGRHAETPQWRLPVSEEQWRAVRKGIYGVVNDPMGTAYRYAYFRHDNLVLCGKTGSATAHPWPIAYDVPYLDGEGRERVATVRAGALGPAIERFVTDHPNASFDPEMVTVAGRWPPAPPEDGGRHSHAWFGGYLQRLDALGEPDWSLTPRIAFAVLVEFGGSGGRTSGPLAREVARVLADRFGPDLDVGRVDLQGGGS